MFAQTSRSDQAPQANQPTRATSDHQAGQRPGRTGPRTSRARERAGRVGRDDRQRREGEPGGSPGGGREVRLHRSGVSSAWSRSGQSSRPASDSRHRPFDARPDRDLESARVDRSPFRLSPGRPEVQPAARGPASRPTTPVLADLIAPTVRKVRTHGSSPASAGSSDHEEAADRRGIRRAAGPDPGRGHRRGHRGGQLDVGPLAERRRPDHERGQRLVTARERRVAERADDAAASRRDGPRW